MYVLFTLRELFNKFNAQIIRLLTECVADSLLLQCHTVNLLSLQKLAIIKTHSSVSAAKKTKKMCGTQVCYLLVPQSCQIQPSVSPKLLS